MDKLTAWIIYTSEFKDADKWTNGWKMNESVLIQITCRMDRKMCRKNECVLKAINIGGRMMSGGLFTVIRELKESVRGKLIIERQFQET